MNNVVYILHGLGADSHANWFPWLKQELKSKGYTVAVPDFPSSAIPDLDEWLNVLHSTIGQYGEGILIGHSLGGLAAIQYLLSGGKSPKVILAATPFAKIDIAPEIDQFFPESNDIKTLRQATFPQDILGLPLSEPLKTEFIVMQSDNDPLIGPTDGQKWTELLQAKYVQLPGLEHLTLAELPEILPYLE